MDADTQFSVTVDRYSRYLNPHLAKLMAFAGFGVEMRAEGCYIYDQEDRPFLDFLGGYGVFTFGHRHPKIIEAVKQQLDIMPLSGKAFFNDVAARLAEKLAQVSPGELQFTFFSNSGTEAVEAALKFAKCATGKSKIISTNGAYHGKTIGALSTTGREKYRTPFMPLMPGVEFVDYGNLEQAQKAVDSQTAAIIIETVQGEGGIHIPPPGYLVGLQELCHKHGALLIVDEVQTGMGRTGRLFGSDHDGLRPDILTLAKSLGGGVIPIGATMMTESVYEGVFGKNPLLHTSTFGGGPLACAAGLAAFDVLESEGLVERSRTMGERLVKGLRASLGSSELVAEVRGLGLIVGVEFAMDEVGELVIAHMLKEGMCAAYTLNNPRVIRLEPPLVVSEAQIDEAVRIISHAVSETSELLSLMA